jgi:hypothetical protein
MENRAGHVLQADASDAPPDPDMQRCSNWYELLLYVYAYVCYLTFLIAGDGYLKQVSNDTRLFALGLTTHVQSAGAARLSDLPIKMHTGIVPNVPCWRTKQTIGTVLSAAKQWQQRSARNTTKSTTPR